MAAGQTTVGPFGQPCRSAVVAGQEEPAFGVEGITIGAENGPNARTWMQCPKRYAHQDHAVQQQPTFARRMQPDSHALESDC